MILSYTNSRLTLTVTLTLRYVVVTASLFLTMRILLCQTDTNVQADLLMKLTSLAFTKLVETTVLQHVQFYTKCADAVLNGFVQL